MLERRNDTWDSIFRDFFGLDSKGNYKFQITAPDHSSFTPAIDVYEDEKAFHLIAELPGVNTDKVKIDVDKNVYKNVLTISGERKLEKEDNTDGYTRIERSYGSFSRSFTLPENVAVDDIAADYKNGILTISLPKTEETPKAKQIPISTK